MYTSKSFSEIPQVKAKLTQRQISNIKVVSQVLPFKVNDYVVNELIDWDTDDIYSDPMFRLTFPHHDMLSPAQFAKMNGAMHNGHSRNEISAIVNEIRLALNPHPAGQLEKNVPTLEGMDLRGLQHKYDHTVLFFPKQGQTCHSYCTFCFRWPQFVGMNDLKFGMGEADILLKYLCDNKQVTDLLVTGGDPMIMTTDRLKQYIEPILDNKDKHNVRTIRIGTKSLGFWPYRFLTDKDADDMLRLFERTVNEGFHLAFMAHFTHPNELRTEAVKKAIARIRQTGAQIRTQAPLLRNINDDAQVWADMWKKQVNLGCIPYYMFVERDTGAHDYFAVPLVKAYEIFQKAYQNVSGICRTVRGPSMSTTSGKVHISGVTRFGGEEYFVLNFIQHRDKNMTGKPFFAPINNKATWFDQLEPASGMEEFFSHYEPEPEWSEVV